MVEPNTDNIRCTSDPSSDKHHAVIEGAQWHQERRHGAVPDGPRWRVGPVAVLGERRDAVPHDDAEPDGPKDDKQKLLVPWGSDRRETRAGADGICDRSASHFTRFGEIVLAPIIRDLASSDLVHEFAAAASVVDDRHASRSFAFESADECLCLVRICPLPL